MRSPEASQQVADRHFYEAVDAGSETWVNA